MRILKPLKRINTFYGVKGFCLKTLKIWSWVRIHKIKESILLKLSTQTVTSRAKKTSWDSANCLIKSRFLFQLDNSRRNSRNFGRSLERGIRVSVFGSLSFLDRRSDLDDAESDSNCDASTSTLRRRRQRRHLQSKHNDLDGELTRLSSLKQLNAKKSLNFKPMQFQLPCSI